MKTVLTLAALMIVTAPAAAQQYVVEDKTAAKFTVVESRLDSLEKRVAALEKTCKPAEVASAGASCPCGDACPCVSKTAADYPSVYARVQAGERLSGVPVPGLDGLYDCWRDPATGRQMCVRSAGRMETYPQTAPYASPFTSQAGDCPGGNCASGSCPGGVCPAPQSGFGLFRRR